MPTLLTKEIILDQLCVINQLVQPNQADKPKPEVEQILRQYYEDNWKAICGDSLPLFVAGLGALVKPMIEINAFVLLLAVYTGQDTSKGEVTHNLVHALHEPQLELSSLTGMMRCSEFLVPRLIIGLQDIHKDNIAVSVQHGEAIMKYVNFCFFNTAVFK